MIDICKSIYSTIVAYVAFFIASISLTFRLFIPLIVGLYYGMSGTIDAVNPQWSISLYYHSSRMRRFFNTFIHWNLFVFVCNAVIYFIPQRNAWLDGMISLFWLLPIWIVSDYNNRCTQGEMMSILCKQKSNMKTLSNTVSPSKASESSKPTSRVKIPESQITSKITDVIYEGVFFMSMHILLSISRGFWSLIFYIFGYSLLCAYSLMSFRLNYGGVSLKNKIKLFEKYWVYFFFYGLPYALMHIILPASLSYPCFHLVASLTLPNTINALPRKNLQWTLPFKIFYLPELLVNRITIVALYITRKIKEK
jgi:hypothetical protein